MDHPSLSLSLQDHYQAWPSGAGSVEVGPAPANPGPEHGFELAPDRWEAWLQTWLQSLYPTLPPSWQQSTDYELSLRFTDSAEIQAFNHHYRQIDRPTDVLAFAALEDDLPPCPDPTAEPLYLGDIVIAVPVAQTQAQTQGHPLLTELIWLAAHGFLHLLGWDHPDEAQLQAMLQQQQRLLEQIGMVGPQWDG